MKRPLFLAAGLAAAFLGCGSSESTSTTSSGGASGASSTGGMAGTGGAGATGGAAGTGATGGAAGSGGAAGGALAEWPNAVSFATSDPWLSEHHADIQVMRPRLLLLNFVNMKTNEQMLADIKLLTDALREGSRYHGYKDAAASPMLDYQIAKSVDLRDANVPANYPYRNSTLYPREDPKQGYWSFDYGKLFSKEFADLYGFKDPGDGHSLDLCELVNQGLVHEVWVYGDADVPDVNAAEILERKIAYGPDNKPLPGAAMNPCAGNGCFDQEDIDVMPAHCTRSIRIGWVNNTRGPGCFLESISHGFESTAQGGVLPYLKDDFVEFGDFDLDARYGTPFNSFYACGKQDCVTYTPPDSLTQKITYDTGSQSGTIDNYLPACGNAHVPPNGRDQYDYGGDSPAVVLSTCEHFHMRDAPGGADASEPWDSSHYAQYNALAPDCGGGFHVYWMQSFPGYGNKALRKDGAPTLPWWPFLYY